MQQDHLNPGDKRTIIADDPPSGYLWDRWTGDTQYLTDPNQAITDVVMPSGNITLTATYSLIPPPPIKYGALYNWYAATDARNIAPVGFHVPTDAEWTILTTYLGGDEVAGGKLKEVGTSHFLTPNTGATNETGFTSRGGGYRSKYGGGFSQMDDLGLYWSTTNDHTVYYYNFAVNYYDAGTRRDYYHAAFGFSIRFIADSGTPTTVTGNDNKVYPCITIGTQTWTATNSMETKFRNGEYIHGYEGGVYTPITNSAWANLITEGMCFYNDDESNG